MASVLTLAYRSIQPEDRAHLCNEKCGGHHEIVANSRRKRPRTALHTRIGPQRDSRSFEILWHTTKPRPWTTRQQRRVRNKVQRQSRRANR